MSRNRFMPDLPNDSGPFEATPSQFFYSRRQFMRATAAATIAGGTVACAQDSKTGQGEGAVQADDAMGPTIPPRVWPAEFDITQNASVGLPQAIEKRTPTDRLVAGSHNNYYEFLYGRGGAVWPLTEKFTIDPWSVEIGGLCSKPMTLGLEEIDKFPHEERLYHFRCVERWAMNVPWVGFPLKTLLERVEPTDDAKYVRFVTARRPKEMPGMAANSRAGWPYHEALRMDEAMNDLTMVVTGAYGEPLGKQHGAPIRIIVPWKYGYKSPKSIVRIELVKDKPSTYWSSPPYAHEYGFLSNVNPNIPHPRWSQAESYWLGQGFLREKFQTPLFNGYEKYVASMYPDEPREKQAALRPGMVAR